MSGAVLVRASNRKNQRAACFLVTPEAKTGAACPKGRRAGAFAAEPQTVPSRRQAYRSGPPSSMWCRIRRIISQTTATTGSVKIAVIMPLLIPSRSATGYIR